MLLVALALAWPREASAEVNWATKRAEERTQSARVLIQKGESDSAIARLNEAISFDSSYGPAYLELGKVQEKLGHTDRAEHAYQLGLERTTDVAALHLARARLRARTGHFEAAAGDLEQAMGAGADKRATLVEMVELRVRSGMHPAALSASRALLEFARRAADADALAAEKVRARALATLARDVDPVAQGASGRGLARSALAKLYANR